MPEADNRQDAGTEELQPITDDDSAMAAVSMLLDEPGGEVEQHEEVDKKTKAVETDEDTDAAADKSDEETRKSSPDDTDTEPPESDEVELPDTLEGFADALDVDPAELAKHVKVKVKSGSGVEEVTLAEALDGQLRHADYTRKTMELAEQRKAVQRFQEAGQQRLEHLDTLISGLAAHLDAGPSDQDLERILMEDGAEAYLSAKSQRDKSVQALNEAWAARQKEMARTNQERDMHLRNYRVEQQTRLKELMPEINDPQKLSALEGELMSGLKDYGFSDAEVSEWFGGQWDARNVMIARDATRYRAMAKDSAKVKKKLKILPKMQRPGTATDKGQEVQERKLALRDKLRQSRTGTKRQQEAAALEYVKDIL